MPVASFQFMDFSKTNGNAQHLYLLSQKWLLAVAIVATKMIPKTRCDKVRLSIVLQCVFKWTYVNEVAVVALLEIVEYGGVIQVG